MCYWLITLRSCFIFQMLVVLATDHEAGLKKKLESKVLPAAPALKPCGGQVKDGFIFNHVSDSQGRSMFTTQTEAARPILPLDINVIQSLSIFLKRRQYIWLRQCEVILGMMSGCRGHPS